MKAAIVSEFRKLVTTRLWWVIALVMAAYMAFMAIVLAAAISFGEGVSVSGMEADMLDSTSLVSTIYGLAPSLGYVFPLIIGTIAFTGEFRYKTLTPTFLADPNRTRVLIAKGIANFILGIFLGVVGVAACLLPGAAVLGISGSDTALGDASTWTDAGLAVFTLAIWAVVGVGVGTLITNQVAAVVVLIAFTQLVEPILRMVFGLVPALQGVGKFLPGAASESLSGGNSIYTASGIASGSLSAWQGGLVLIAYGVLFAIVGRLTTLRRDVV